MFAKDRFGLDNFQRGVEDESSDSHNDSDILDEQIQYNIDEEESNTPVKENTTSGAKRERENFKSNGRGSKRYTGKKDYAYGGDDYYSKGNDCEYQYKEKNNYDYYGNDYSYKGNKGSKANNYNRKGKMITKKKLPPNTREIQVDLTDNYTPITPIEPIKEKAKETLFKNKYDQFTPENNQTTNNQVNLQDFLGKLNINAKEFVPKTKKKSN